MSVISSLLRKRHKNYVSGMAIRQSNSDVEYITDRRVIRIYFSTNSHMEKSSLVIYDDSIYTRLLVQNRILSSRSTVFGFTKSRQRAHPPTPTTASAS